MNTSIIEKNRKRTFGIVASFAEMAFVGIMLVLAAIVTALLINHFWQWGYTTKKYIGYLGYICWGASLGAKGREIETRSGNSFPERLNHWLSNYTSLIGLFMFVLSQELTTKS
jgi:hypothetical protein